MERIDPERVLENLKAEATTRKRRSLDLVHNILIDQGESGSRDFSIATIGRLCAEAGGPSPQSIRNKGGADYRRLIEAHAAFHGTTRKKPLSATSRGNLPRSAEDLLKRIEDPALRAVFGSIVAERNALAQECRVLKANVELVVDRREEHGPRATVEVLPALTGLLTPMEREALDEAVSERLLAQRGWQAFDNGRIKDANGRTIYKPGYVTAIRKILAESAKR
jgi:hypothetical protein